MNLNFLFCSLSLFPFPISLSLFYPPSLPLSWLRKRIAEWLDYWRPNSGAYRFDISVAQRTYPKSTALSGMGTIEGCGKVSRKGGIKGEEMGTVLISSWPFNTLKNRVRGQTLPFFCWLSHCCLSSSHSTLCLILPFVLSLRGEGVVGSAQFVYMYEKESGFINIYISA